MDSFMLIIIQILLNCYTTRIFKYFNSLAQWSHENKSIMGIRSKVLSEDDMNLSIKQLKPKLASIGLNDLINLKRITVEKRPDKKSAWIVKGEKQGVIYAWYLEHDSVNGWEIEDYRSGKNYISTPLPTYGKNAKEKNYQLIYSEVCNSWRQLVGVRFKLLGLLPVVSLAIFINLLNSNLSWWIQILICMLGFIFTYAIRLYDIRNSELHDQLISRGRKIEEELKIENGQFMGRKDKGHNYLFNLSFSLTKIKHDNALSILYNTALIAWILIIILIFLSTGIDYAIMIIEKLINK